MGKPRLPDVEKQELLDLPMLLLRGFPKRFAVPRSPLTALSTGQTTAATRP